MHWLGEYPLRSPITGQKAEQSGTSFGSSWPFKIDHPGVPISTLYTDEETVLTMGNPSHFCRSTGFSPKEVGEAFHLVRAYLWRNAHTGAPPFLLTTGYSHSFSVSLIEENRLRLTAIPLEQFVLEMRSLTFVDKALRTLENLALLWSEKPEPFILPYSRGYNGADRLLFGYSPTVTEDGTAYGCDPHIAPHVYEFLLDEGYLKAMPYTAGGDVRPVTISPKGFAELDRIKKGKGLVTPEAFLVRRYDTELDKFLNPVMKEVETRLNCPIKAVWDREHNDRIDERIFRLIREAAVTVVDVSPDRFNVGLELGYALALGKPIVVIRERPAEDAPEYKKQLPFDIQTLNCYTYERSNREELVEKLVARIGIALETLKHK